MKFFIHIQARPINVCLRACCSRVRPFFLLVACAVLLTAYAPASGAKRIFNYAYVKSDLGGVFYARCVPEKNEGDQGSTDIFRVANAGDQLVDKYDWYNRNGLILSWSPIVGKVAVMRLQQDENQPFEQQIEFSFYIGGKHLKSYTSSDLAAIGAAAVQDMYRTHKRAAYEVIGPEQIPGTNEYVFSIMIGKRKTSFDITTGRIYRESKT